MILFVIIMIIIECEEEGDRAAASPALTQVS